MPVPVLGAAACWILLLTACAVAPRTDPWGEAVSRGRIPAGFSVPDSLQADLIVEPSERGAPSFAARLYARPELRYRLDIQGFTGVIASWAWDAGAWTLVRHDEKTVLRGVGDKLEIRGAPLRLPDVHVVLGFAWGELLPGLGAASSPNAARVVDTIVGGKKALHLEWTHADETWKARFDPRTGQCREVRSPTLTLRYADYRKFGDRLLPAEVEVFAEGERLFTLRLKERVLKPAWKKDPFVLKVPEGYEER